MKTTIIQTLLFLVIAIFSFENCKKPQVLEQPDNFRKGLLDLSNTNLDQEKAIVLQGKWEFYWKEFIAYADNEETIKKKLTGYFAPGETWRAIAPEIVF